MLKSRMITVMVTVFVVWMGRPASGAEYWVHPHGDDNNPGTGGGGGGVYHGESTTGGDGGSGICIVMW